MTFGIPFTKLITSWKSISPLPRKRGGPCNLLEMKVEEVVRHEGEFFPMVRHAVGPVALMAHLPAAVRGGVEDPADLLPVVADEAELERALNMSKPTSRSMANNSETLVSDLKETLLTASPPMVSKDL